MPGIETAAILKSFLDADGRLMTVPAKRGKRLVVLDHLAQRFEPGERYPETEVNNRLREVHDDVAALRRYLVDEGFLRPRGRRLLAQWRQRRRLSSASGR